MSSANPLTFLSTARRKKGVATKKRSSEEREDVPLEDEVGRGADGANKHRRLDSEQVGVEAADLGGMDYVDYNDYGGGGDAGQADRLFPPSFSSSMMALNPQDDSCLPV